MTQLFKVLWTDETNVELYGNAELQFFFFFTGDEMKPKEHPTYRGKLWRFYRAVWGLKCPLEQNVLSVMYIRAKQSHEVEGTACRIKNRIVSPKRSAEGYRKSCYIESSQENSGLVNSSVEEV